MDRLTRKSMWSASCVVAPFAKSRRNVKPAMYGDWKLLDAAEQAAGADQGRPRVKYVEVGAMLERIGANKVPA